MGYPYSASNATQKLEIALKGLPPQMQPVYVDQTSQHTPVQATKPSDLQEETKATVENNQIIQDVTDAEQVTQPSNTAVGAEHWNEKMADLNRRYQELLERERLLKEKEKELYTTSPPKHSGEQPQCVIEEIPWDYDGVQAKQTHCIEETTAQFEQMTMKPNKPADTCSQQEEKKSAKPILVTADNIDKLIQQKEHENDGIEQKYVSTPDPNTMTIDKKKEAKQSKITDFFKKDVKTQAKITDFFKKK